MYTDNWLKAICLSLCVTLTPSSLPFHPGPPLFSWLYAVWLLFLIAFISWKHYPPPLWFSCLWHEDLFWPFESLDLLSYLFRWLIMNFPLFINYSRSLFIPTTSADYIGNKCHQLWDFSSFIQHVSIRNWGLWSFSNLCILVPALTIECIRSAAKRLLIEDSRLLETLAPPVLGTLRSHSSETILRGVHSF